MHFSYAQKRIIRGSSGRVNGARRATSAFALRRRLLYRAVIKIPSGAHMSLRTALCIAACVAVCTALPAAAALYKWTDENGRVVYGDTPPPGAKAERISVAAPAADSNAVRDMASKDAELKKRQQDRDAETAKAEKAFADNKARADRCVQIRGRMQTLRSGAALYRFNEAGEKVYYDAAERDKAIAEADRNLRELNCAPVGTAGNTPAGTNTY
jgi:hypothetical protein